MWEVREEYEQSPARRLVEYLQSSPEWDEQSVIAGKKLDRDLNYPALILWNVKCFSLGSQFKLHFLTAPSTFLYSALLGPISPTLNT